jgi:hypothetical protein
MRTIAFTAPYMRVSNLHIPRRDLVLAAGDSLTLQVTVVDRDSPDAEALEITDGLGGYQLLFAVWADAPGQYFCDYGTPLPRSGQTLWSGLGTLTDTPGTVTFTFPSGTMASWPLRCGWSVQLQHDRDTAEVLLSGTLYVRPGLGTAYRLEELELQTLDFINVHTDPAEHLIA